MSIFYIFLEMAPLGTHVCDLRMSRLHLVLWADDRVGIITCSGSGGARQVLCQGILAPSTQISMDRTWRVCSCPLRSGPREGNVIARRLGPTGKLQVDMFFAQVRTVPSLRWVVIQ